MPRPKRQTEDTISETPEFVEKMVELKRTSKKTQGGNRFRFTALMVVGDQNGRLGIGLGKARDVVSAIKKGVRRAKKQMFTVELIGDAKTISHDIKIKYKGAEIMLKPAPSGTGVMAGGAIRTIAEAAGIRNVVGKIIGTDNPKSNIQATIQALQGLKKPSERKADIVYKKGSTKKTMKKSTETPAVKEKKITKKTSKKGAK
jgi:small subunit ribosomal protein S5